MSQTLQYYSEYSSEFGIRFAVIGNIENYFKDNEIKYHKCFICELKINPNKIQDNKIKIIEFIGHDGNICTQIFDENNSSQIKEFLDKQAIEQINNDMFNDVGPIDDIEIRWDKICSGIKYSYDTVLMENGDIFDDASFDAKVYVMDVAVITY